MVGGPDAFAPQLEKIGIGDVECALCLNLPHARLAKLPEIMKPQGRIYSATEVEVRHMTCQIVRREPLVHDPPFAISGLHRLERNRGVNAPMSPVVLIVQQ